MTNQKGISRSDLIAFMALLMSLGAVIIAVKQTQILKSQQEIMASQQEGSVWPHVTTATRLITKNGRQEIHIAIENKGVGPAKIKSCNIISEGVVLSDYKTLLQKLVEYQPENLSFGDASNRVMAPQESFDILKLELPVPIPHEVFAELLGNIEICYCSIYDQCYGDCEE